MMYMTETVGLPASIAHSIDLLVESLGGLEALLALHRESERSWTADEMAAHLRISPRAARQELDRMTARGVAARALSGDDPVYRYRPADADQAAHVARIADAYATRRIETINHVASSRLRRMRAAQ
jgi:predicted ArsR family transcriptional regulator